MTIMRVSCCDSKRVAGIVNTDNEDRLEEGPAGCV